MTKKTIITHGKFWLLACVLSLFSFVFLQLDSNKIPNKQQTVEISQDISDEGISERELINKDAIKVISAFIYGVLKL